LIELRLSQELPASFAETLKGVDLSGFLLKGPIRRGEVSFKVTLDKPGVASVDLEETLGWRYETGDASRVVILRRNGITVSTLKNYTNWGELRDQAKQVWQKFVALSGHVIVSRLAVRYINVIQAPVGSDYDLYLTAGPRVPEELPQFVSTFLQRVVISYSREGPEAIVTHAMEPAVDQMVPLILDIDVYHQQRFPSDDLAIWDRLDALRRIKNAIFFASVTEKALEPYK
jgi:uncharacterized protein (TIGR04255 family)